VHNALKDLPTGPPGPSAAHLNYVQRVSDALVTDVTELRKLESIFEVNVKGRVDAQGRPKILKLRWARHRKTIEELRERISSKRSDLANALSILQTGQGTRTASLVVNLVEVCNERFADIASSTRRTDSTVENLRSDLVVSRREYERKID
jgi:hypothetical protein